MKPNGSNNEIEELIGYHFHSPDLLNRALTRLAYAKEEGIRPDFHMDAYATLGDAVIELLILTRLVNVGGYDKGEISVKKMDLVNMSVLRQASERIGLYSHIKWGKGEIRMHVWTSGRVLAECIEALAGAVYLDGGLEAASVMIIKVGLIPDHMTQTEIHKQN